MSLRVTLMCLIDAIPQPPLPAKRRPGSPRFSPDRRFLKALVIMLVRPLHTDRERLAVLAEPTAEMRAVRGQLPHHGRSPGRRTRERRLAALPAALPAQLGRLGRELVARVQPRVGYGRAAAVGSTVPRARGGVWHKVHRYTTPGPRRRRADDGRIPVPSRYGRSPPADDGVALRRAFHGPRSLAIEHCNGPFKGSFDGHGPVFRRGEGDTARFALGAVVVYHLALLHRRRHGLPLHVGLKAFLKAA